jgi:hypothetical protein
MSPGEPAQLGRFHLMGQLGQSAAGVVFLGVDPDGLQVSVAVLRRGAAADAAARDRFGAAVVAASVVAGVVVDAEPEGAAPWVAVPYVPDGVGAERFLAEVELSGPAGGRGPRFLPYWAGWGDPVFPAPVAPEVTMGAPPGARPARWRGFGGVLVGLAAGLAGLALLLLLLFACAAPVPAPPAPSFPVLPPVPAPSVAPSASPAPTGSPSPGADGSGANGLLWRPGFVPVPR